MRTHASAAALCLFVGAVAVGCADAGDRADPRSAGQLLGEANRTMKALTSVTRSSSLDSRCTQKTSWFHGAELEHIRIGETDYIHPNDVYLEMWGRKTVPAMRSKPWLKSPVSAAKGADELSDCAWPFSSFGKATKGRPTDLDGKPVIPVKVADEVEGGTSTFYVAAEGEPYLLRVDHQGRHQPHRITTFSGFNNPVDIQPPETTDVLDLSTLPPDAS